MSRQMKWILANAGCALLALCFLFFLLFSLKLDAMPLSVVLFLFFAASVGIWIYMNLSFVRDKPATLESAAAGSAAETAATLARLEPKAFKEEIRTCQMQLARLEQKKEIFSHLLQDTFGDSQITTRKFQAGIDKAEALFLANQKQIIQRILLFDQEGWEKARRNHTEPAGYSQAMAFIRQKIDENETILDKMDELAARLASLDSPQALEDKSVIRQLDQLSEQTEYYRQKNK